MPPWPPMSSGPPMAMATVGLLPSETRPPVGRGVPAVVEGRRDAVNAVNEVNEESEESEESGGRFFLFFFPCVSPS